tara:strand:- start:160 stop:1674 length:1515 start_codon:yes stop_codon:yes gene_type:complete
MAPEVTEDIFKINGEDYECKFILYNSVDGKDHRSAIHLTKGALKSLVIEENLFEPFITATAIINNPVDMIEERLVTKGNGTDRLFISFYSQEDARLRGSKEKYIVSESIKVEYEFVIVGESNSVSETDRFGNFKIYDLVDLNYHKLNSRVPFEEADGIPNEFYGKPIGEIIKNLLKTNLGEGVVDDDPTEGNWDNGNHITVRQPETFDSLKTFDFRTSDLIKYLLSIYYKDEDGTAVQGILHYNRIDGIGLKQNAFSLRPISTIFKDNKNKLTEGFKIGELDNKEEGAGTNKNNPTLTNSKLGFSNINQSQLPNTSLSTPMFNYSNRYFINYKVNTHEVLTSTTDITILKIADKKKSWSKIFVDEAFSATGGKPIAFMPLHLNSSKYKTITYPFSHNVNVKLAEAQMMSNLTFLNLQLGFTNLGFTRRSCSQFIDIIRPAGGTRVRQYDSKKKKFIDMPGFQDTKLLGRWLVTNCRHELIGDRYLNAIQCVKTYVGPDLEGLIQ